VSQVSDPGFLKASVDVALERDEFNTEFRSYLKQSLEE
jgi:UTP-glucose-1-phosphate uridylyltransferase